MTNNHSELQQAVQFLAARCDGAFKVDHQGFNGADTDFGRSLAEKPFWSPKQARAAWKMLRKYRKQLALGDINFDAIPEPSNGDDFPLPHESAYEFVLTFGKHNGKSLGELAEDAATRSYVEWLGAKSYTANVKFAAQKTLAGRPLTEKTEIAVKAESGGAEITAALVGKKIIVRFAWGCRNFDEAKDAVKSVPGRKWDGDDKAWTVPLAQAGALLEAMKSFDNFQAAEDIKAAVTAQEEERDALRVASKAGSSDFQVEGLGGELYPFQSAGVEYALKTRRAIIGDDMGLGKTIEALATIKAADAFPALIVCPATLKINWAREAMTWLTGKTVAVWSGRNSNKEADLADVIIINYDIIHDPKKPASDPKASVLRDDLKAIKFKAVVLDECLPYNSLVMTNCGLLPIGKIVENKLPVSVLTCNFSNNVLEYKPVIQWVRNPLLGDLVRIIYEHGNLVCTPTHKIWTEEKGYVRAGALEGGETMRVMRKEVFDIQEGQDNSKILLPQLCSQTCGCKARNKEKDSGSFEVANGHQDMRMVRRELRASAQGQADKGTTFLWDILFGKMEDEPARNPQENIYPTTISEAQPEVERPSQAKSALGETSKRTNDFDEPRPSIQSQSRCSNTSLASREPEFSLSRRQTPFDETSDQAARGPGVFDRVVGVFCGDWASQEKARGQRQRYANKSTALLQHRYSASAEQDSHRGRRRDSQDQEMAMDRCSEREGFIRSRVVSIEILERGDIERLGLCSEGNPIVYNLEVEDNHNYFAEGLLVSNSHFIKSYKAKRTRAARELGRRKLVRLCLTGTPILNRPQELISQLAFLGRLDDFGGFWHFAKRYCAAYRGRFGWDMSGADHLEELHDKMMSSCYIRRRKADVLKELPAKTRTIIPIPIDNRREYEKAKRDVIGWVGQKAADDKEFNQSIAHLPKDERNKAKDRRRDQAKYRARQAEHLVRIEALKQIAVKGKMKAIKDWMENFLETGEKLVVFAHHREIVQELAREFKAQIIIGGQSFEDRDAAVQKFQNDSDCRVIVSSIRAGGVGLTLTAASNVLTVELGWTPADHLQSEDRLHRIGQEYPVNSWVLIGHNTIEEDIAALLDRKALVVDAATDGANGKTFSIMRELMAALTKGEEMIA